MAKLEALASAICDPAQDPFFESYRLALVLLNMVFGAEWFDKYITDEPSKSFLATPLYKENGEVLTMVRIRDLAELVVNMLPNTNAEAAIYTMLTDSIQSGYSELKVGKILRHYGFEYNFNWPTGKRGDDFDVTFMFLDKRLCAGEVKSIQEDTEYKVSTIKNRIADARKRNLPKEKPCTIFLHLPIDWFENNAFPRDMENVKDEIFRSTGRVVNIFSFSEKLHFHEGNFYAEMVCREYLNNNGSFGNYLEWSIIHHRPTFLDDKFGWFDLYDICSCIPLVG